MPFFFLAKDKIDIWASKLAEEFAVYFPALCEDSVHFRKFNSRTVSSTGNQTIWALDRIRAVEPVKAFLFEARETVARFPATEPLPGKERRQIIIGAKNCDIMPLRVHQKLLLERDYVDPWYQLRLKNTIIISADCPTPEATCFCNLLGLPPYVESGSDIVLTALETGYLVEPISAVGRDLVFGRDKPFRPATDDEVGARDLLRRQAVAALKNINPQPLPADLPALIDRRKDEEYWRAAARDCVECYACLMACPTCFCYLLYDQAISQTGGNELPSFDRIRVWDACYYQRYGRVGGGMNVRPRMWERFRNRFHCKWLNCTRDFGFHSCSGCGRCYESCMGKIDIRKVLGGW